MKQTSKLSQNSASSKIQTLPAELKLSILMFAANIFVVKTLVMTCPGFYPVYCENRRKVLLSAHQDSHDLRTDRWLKLF